MVKNKLMVVGKIMLRKREHRNYMLIVKLNLSGAFEGEVISDGH